MGINLFNRRSFLRNSALGGLATAFNLSQPANAAPAGSAANQGTGRSPDAVGDLQPFLQPDLNFQVLFALGCTAYGAGETGEIFATIDHINKHGASYQTFYDGFISRARRTAGIAAKSAAGGHAVSARSAHTRAAQYYNQALFFVLGTSTPDAEPDVYKKMQQQWDAATRYFAPPFEPVRIPYEGMPLPGYFLRGGSGRRPTIIINNGSDAQFVDVYAFGAAAAVERGWHALIFEGPGQGSLLFEHKIPFRPDWEAVITPIVDYLCARPDVDTDRIALTGWSFGGLLVTRAAAFEHRLAAVVADPGSVDSWAAYPENLRNLVDKGGSQDKVDAVWRREVMPHIPPQARFTLAKRAEIYGKTFLEAARKGEVFDSLWSLAQQVKAYRVTDTAPDINTPMLVTQYEGEQFYQGGGEALYQLLGGEKQLITFTQAEGAGLHNGPLAPQRRNQRIYDWLEERFHRGRSAT